MIVICSVQAVDSCYRMQGDSACDPLAALQRWITYTQNELITVRGDVRLLRDEATSVQRIQQSQLDVLTTQVRDMESQISEILSAVTELFSKLRQTNDVLGNLLADMNAIQNTVPQQQSSELPPTKPAEIDISD